MKKFSSIILTVIMFCFCLFGNAYAAETIQNMSWNNPTRIKTYIPPKHKYTEKMKRACYRWSLMTHNGIIFKYVDSAQNAQIVVKFVDRIPKGLSLDTAVGVTSYTYSPANSLFQNAEIYIADYSIYGKLTDDEVFTAMLHELGHAIGLGHSNSPNSIMYPSVEHVKTMDISAEDLEILAKKYKWR